MTPSARIQAAIDILDKVIIAAQSKTAPADRIMSEWARANRYAGSKDRRAVRELVFGAIRACGPVPANGRAAMLRLAQTDPQILPLFDGSQYGPAAIGEGEEPTPGGVAPDWLVRKLFQSDITGDEATALLSRAPLDVRVNSLKTDRGAVMAAHEGEALVAPHAIRYPTGTRVDDWAEAKDGKLEVQDLGSQIACLAVEAKAGETVIDLCAGAGGKALALAAAMDNLGTLIASDTDRRRLGECNHRMVRAGATNIETVLLNPNKEAERLEPWNASADAVLVDAPCSGSGTWRRKPETRWRLSPDVLDEFAAVQDRLLAIGASLVKPGGRLVFVTCSLLDQEGPDRIAAFLEANPDWKAQRPALPAGRGHGDGTRLTPYHDGTDGFFIASLVLAC
ncbi:16S rRNA (cytosine(967)-C(5))-methyltransferase [Alteripontixanthobacter maritimus]|uniref:16S rRNA (Cytosine(967)-C(5))-methyltransferase n=1 Tax=Alteripontixanthobacter maritimus TaxID=2161824 RepID=A0A369Q5X8_9SPHN|nr:RsmB/NOP family class I SAM-dependent RNA methyltransferase [Alteripontixanthobacter maritimus]RDC60124.1 16S rRNA (cytosine(967)-C(5))-methyltransferase [Alteripontixanthobacter maritimus]